MVGMRALGRKALRDIRSSKWQYAALILLVALGIAAFGGMYSGYHNLASSEELSYDELSFADLAVRVREAPREVVGQLRAVPGVQAALGRLMWDVSLGRPSGSLELVSGRFISLPGEHHPSVNDVLVKQGSYFTGSEDQGILIERGFAEYHGLRPGDSLYPVIGGERIPLEIRGVVITPEYLWPAKSRQELMTEPGAFGVLFLTTAQAERLFGRPEVINEVCLILQDSAQGQAVRREVERIMAPFGVMDIVPREDQPSYALLKMDLEGFGEIAVFVPACFLLVTALVTYVLLTRTVHAQRAQIGVMRAIGYSRRQLLLHYLSFALLIAALGGAVGSAVGYFLGAAITRLYADTIHIPFTSIRMDWGIIAIGIVLALAFCGAAGILPARAAARMAPAEAMRTPPPAVGRSPLIERIFPFLSRLPYTWKVPLRNLFRSRRRTLYTTIGIAMALGLVLASFAMFDAIDLNMGLQYGGIQAYDLRLTLAQPQPSTLITELGSWEGVERAEPILEIPARLIHGDESYSTLLVALSPGSRLYRLRAASQAVPLSGEGLFLAKGLARSLGVEVGDAIKLQTPLGRKETRVAGLVKQPIGSLAYLSLEEAQRMAGLEGIVSGAMLKVEKEHLAEVKARLYRVPGAFALEELARTRESLSEIMGLFYEFAGVMVLFGLALGFAAIFNTVTINVLERAREMATMRTLGTSRRQIAFMITLENLLMGAAGIILGVGFGIALDYELLMMFQSDLFSMEFGIYPRTYAIAILGVLLVLMLSQIPAIRYVNGLDLARVIKEQTT